MPVAAMPVRMAVVIVRVSVRVGHVGSVVDAGIEPVTPDDADPAFNPVTVAREPPSGALHRALLGAGEGRCHPARLVGGQARGGVAEIALRSGLGAVGSDPGLRDACKEYFDWPTYPMLIVKGDIIGGVDIMKELHAQGALKAVLGA